MVKRPLGIVCLILTCMIFLVTEISGKKERELPAFSDSRICIIGTVYKKEPPSEKNPGGIIYLKDVQQFQNVICYLESSAQMPKTGSRVKVQGFPSTFEKATNPGQFDTHFYYQLSNISFRLSQAKLLAESTSYNGFREELYSLRCFLAQQIRKSLSKEDAAVVNTILLGEKGDLDSNLKALYQRNGIAHILSISGLHISMLGMGVYHMLRKAGVPVGASAVLSAMLMLCYGMMTGFSVSMQRAMIMFFLHMLAKLAGRTYDMLTAVGVAAVLVLSEQPLYLQDGGFVFSFGCVLGIGLLLPALTEGKRQLPTWCKSLLSGCTMAVISFPMYLWFYYQFPPYSVLLNLLIVPLMSFLMAAGLILIAAQLLFPWAAWLPAMMISGILHIYKIACSFCDKLPLHALNRGKPAAWQIILYVLILLLIVWLKKRVSMGIKWLLVSGAVLILCIRPAGQLEITFLDVGQGDCIYVKSPEGKHYLIDGGSSSVSDVGQYRILPFLKWSGVREVEAVVITHPDEDHINGILYLLENSKLQGITLQALVLPQVEDSLKNSVYRELEAGAAESGVRVDYICAGEGIRDGEMVLECLNPSQSWKYSDSNEYSVVLALYYRKFSALLTGDVEGVGEQAMLNSLDMRSRERKKSGSYGSRGSSGFTVLKVAHHGSKYSSGAEFLAKVKPLYAVISCGKDNSYGHPHEETLERLSGSGTRICQTPDSGAVMLRTDGEKMIIEEFRKGRGEK